MDEPITLDEAKLHLRVEDDGDDDLIIEQIVAAREWVEDYTGLYLAQREVTESVDRFTAATRLRAWPVAETEPLTLVYRDSFGAVQTITNATITNGVRPAVLYPAADARWPLNRTLVGPITVTFTAGYADVDAIPRVLRQAMKVMLTAFYEDREGGEIFAAAEASAKRLCRRYKRHTL